MKRSQYGMVGLLCAFLAVVLVLTALDAHSVNDGTTMRLAPWVAELVGVVSDVPKAEPAFRPSNRFELSEENVILAVGGVGILLGLIASLFGFIAVKRNEHPATTYGAVVFGIAPIILIDLTLGFISFLIVAPILIWFKKYYLPSLSR